MEIVSTLSDFRKWRGLKPQRGGVSFVPTMGALHEGHRGLLRRATHFGKPIVVSIYVNPLQFGPSEDYARYPRKPSSDLELCRKNEVACVFMPEPSDSFVQPPQISFLPGALAMGLCGKSRPGHFSGVLAICLKFFQVVLPRYAFFGEKDFQQLRLIETLVDDFHLPIEIIRVPTVRNKDGLAMSSRNHYLSAQERGKAVALWKGLALAQKACAHHSHLTVGQLLAQVKTCLSQIKLDYLAIVSENDLKPCRAQTPVSALLRPRIFIAGWVGKTRLIDNAQLAQGKRGRPQFEQEVCL